MAAKSYPSNLEYQTSQTAPEAPRDLLSNQVTGSRYFFLELAPRKKGPWSVALGGCERCNPDYLVDRDHYKYFVLELVVEGAGEVTINGRTSALQPGSLFAYLPQSRVRLRTDPAHPMFKYFFALNGGGVKNLLHRSNVTPGIVHGISAHAELRTVAEDLIREGQRNRPLSKRTCRLLLELLLLKVMDAATWEGHGSSLAFDNFLRCRSVIDAQPERYATLADVAVAAGMDVSSICRLFRRYQGTSPYQYLLRRKLNLAAEFLVDTGGLVKEAAQRVGFSDPFHFARCFRAVHGVPPSSLRGRRH